MASGTRDSAAAGTGPERGGWDASSLADPHRDPDKAVRVEAMFNAIAPTYERVNALASLGCDAVWRRRAVAGTRPRSSDVVLDVCCGTGDMLREFARHAPPPARLIGVDFAQQMLEHGDYTGVAPPVELIRGDALDLPLADAAVDIVSCAFGVRNFQDLDAGLREMHRVLRVGGRIVILEFAPPRNPVLRWLHAGYTRTVLPWLGRLVARDASRAYDYLPRSIHTFDTRPRMERRLGEAGFANVESAAMNLGGVVVYRAVKRPSS